MWMTLNMLNVGRSKLMEMTLPSKINGRNVAMKTFVVLCQALTVWYNSWIYCQSYEREKRHRSILYARCVWYNIVYTLIQLHIITCTHSYFILTMALCRTFIAVGSATCVGARFTQFRFPKAVFLLCSFQNLHILVHFVGFGCILPGSNNLLLGRFKLCRCLLLHSSLRPWPSCPMAEVEQSAPYGVYTAQPTVLETWSWFQLKISTVGSILLCLNLGRKKTNWR